MSGDDLASVNLAYELGYGLSKEVALLDFSAEKYKEVPIFELKCLVNKLFLPDCCSTTFAISEEI